MEVAGKTGGSLRQDSTTSYFVLPLKGDKEELANQSEQTTNEETMTFQLTINSSISNRKHGGLLLSHALLQKEGEQELIWWKVREMDRHLILQLQVEEQHNTNCCGYYALHNACIVLEAVQHPHPDTAVSHLKM